MKKALIIGGNGFIGRNLTLRLKSEDWLVKWYVKVIDNKKYAYGEDMADEIEITNATDCKFDLNSFDRVYQLAADMGGAGFVFTGENDAEILTNSLSINLNLVKQAVEQNYKGIIFYSSSVCVYPAEAIGKESDAYPANPPSDYGWEKLTSERIYQAYAKNHGLNVKIARFHNTFGPYGTYEGGREKFPAAVCRKVALADKEIEIWGDGLQERPFIFIEDLLDGIEALMTSDFQGPVNLGPNYAVTINEMVDMVSEIAGKKLKKVYVDGPTGEQKRHPNVELAKEKLNWSAKRDLKESFTTTYNWIKSKIK